MADRPGTQTAVLRISTSLAVALVLASLRCSSEQPPPWHPLASADAGQDSPFDSSAGGSTSAGGAPAYGGGAGQSGASGTADAGGSAGSPSSGGTSGSGPCDPEAAGTGLPVLTGAPPYSVQVGMPVPAFRSLTAAGKQHYPDGQVTFMPAGGQWEVYLPVTRESYRLVGNTPLSATLDPASPVLAPSGSTSDPFHGYAGVTTVLNCGGQRVAFAHAEYHAIPVAATPQCPAPYLASMVRATSPDGSLFTPDDPSWVIDSSGAPDYQLGKCAFGAGGGSIFGQGDYLFQYYFDWDAPNGIYLARACSSSCGTRGSWRKWNGQSFSGDAAAAHFDQSTGPSSPVVPAGAGSFDAFQSVSRNSYLEAYLMVAATEGGFALRTSKDGVTWSARTPLLQHLAPQDGAIPVLYPTLVDAQTWSRDETGRELKLIYAMVADDTGASASHRAFVADVELTRSGDAPTLVARRQLVRYLRQSSPHDHWCTSAFAPGYEMENLLGWMAANSEPDTRPVYDCLLGGKDRMASVRSDCEGGARDNIMGYVWTLAAPQRHPIYRCWYQTSEGHSDHFLSLASDCEGSNAEGVFGYVE